MTKDEMKEMLMEIENMKVEREKKRSNNTALTTVATILTMLTLLSGIVMAFTVVREGVKTAQAEAQKALCVAEKAKEQGENNAREFAFFKGEVNAKLDNINKNVDRIARVVENLEVVADGKGTH